VQELCVGTFIDGGRIMLRRLIWILPLVLCCESCTRGEGLTQVRGKVYIGEESATKGMGFVTFHPDSAKANKSLEEAVGAIQPDGTYVLETRGKPGATKGWYKVGVSLSEVVNPNNPYVTKWLMPNPEKYQNWGKSGISIEVVDKPQPGHYDIKLPPLSSAAK
jgi:hypothetical protein